KGSRNLWAVVGKRIIGRHTTVVEGDCQLGASQKPLLVAKVIQGCVRSQNRLAAAEQQVRLLLIQCLVLQIARQTRIEILRCRAAAIRPQHQSVGASATAARSTRRPTRSAAAGNGRTGTSQRTGDQ